MFTGIVVSMVFVKSYGFTAICFADQTAWIVACCYIVPTCFWCVRKVSGKMPAADA